MRIFLTGGAGFIGRRLLRALVSHGHEVTLLLLPQEESEPLDGVHTVAGDIAEPDSLRGLLAGHQAVIHMAALVGYGQQMAACMRVNARGTANLADAAIRAGVRRFLHMSSVSVYGRITDQPITEDRPLRRTGDPYGDSKIAAEEILRRFQARGLLDITLIRPSVIYGPGDRLFLPKLLENLAGGKSIVIGDGRNRVDLIHVDDVVRFILLILDQPVAYGEAYNLTHAGNGDWNGLVRLLNRSLGRPARIVHIPYRLAYLMASVTEGLCRINGRPPRMTRYAVRVVGRPYNYVIDKARDQLGFVARVGLEEGLGQALTAMEE